jgi:hypothetical protein
MQVLPALWVAPLWGALLRGGGVAVGQREWRWAAADQVLQLPCVGMWAPVTDAGCRAFDLIGEHASQSHVFASQSHVPQVVVVVPRRFSPCNLQGCAAFPWDFPDSRAGAADAADELTVHNAKRAKATKAKQPHVSAQWELLAALPPQQPPAEPQQAAPPTAAVLEGGAALHAAAAAVDQQPADEQPAALVQPAAPAGSMSTDGTAEPCCMDIDGVKPSAVTATAAVAELGAAGTASSATVQGAHTASDGSGAAAGASADVPLSLPPGWWVARSAAALQQVMPHTRLLHAAAATPQRRPPIGGAAAAAAPAAAAAQAPAAADTPAASAPGAGLPSQQAAEAAHLAPASTTQPAAGGAVDRTCLVRVRLHMAGRGVAQPGAAVCGPAAGAGSSTDAGEQQLIGFVMAPAVRGASAWAGATALCGAEALDRYACSD